MGFSSGTVNHFLDLGRRGKIRPRARVLEFGSQNMHTDITLSLAREFARTFEASPADRLLARDILPGTKAEHLMRDVGFDYVAFDVFKGGATRIFDLNSGRIGWLERGRYDVVTNYGTTEHVANQYNAFKVAHDALRVGGVMMNSVPFWGHVNHGLINYHPKFFTHLIKANGYETIYFGLSDIYEGGAIDRYMDAGGADNGEKWVGMYVGCAQMTVFFQKTSDAPFRPPVDTGEHVQIIDIYRK